MAKRAGHPEIDTTCPKCHQAPETLGHVLNACTPNAGLMRERHNTILQRLVKAVPREAGDKFVEQKIRDSAGDLRPDLVILNSERKTATIVDVTIPYEGEVASFEAARAEKLRKYHPLKEWLIDQGFTTSCHAFIVGALGAWDPTSDDALQALGIGRKYSYLFRKLCVSDAIKGSNVIWRARTRPRPRPPPPPHNSLATQLYSLLFVCISNCICLFCLFSLPASG